MSRQDEKTGRKGLIIAIDGPSGAGKSTIAKLLADLLGYLYLDTGAMYRTVALKVKESGISIDDESVLADLCRKVNISFKRSKDGGCRVFSNGKDVSDAIRTPEISMLTSRISANRSVRDVLVRLQRKIGASGGVVLEGRDIGTVVFPDADIKFFLSASASERGKRRFLELSAKGDPITLEQTIAEVVQRDAQDERREHAPLRRADDAVDIDTTSLSIEEVLSKMEAVIRAKAASLSCPE
ncbi:MAG TPA: (d)CMP kinase [Geobacteraceae bacterium]|nr:(d)CMP kinase [Geobacteraceae bacterium]